MRVDPKGRIHIVWPAVVTERGSQVKALFHAVSTDGQAFLPRTRIPTEGQANHPQLAVAANGSLSARLGRVRRRLPKDCVRSSSRRQ